MQPRTRAYNGADVSDCARGVLHSGSSSSSASLMLRCCIDKCSHEWCTPGLCYVRRCIPSLHPHARSMVWWREAGAAEWCIKARIGSLGGHQVWWYV